MDGLFWKTEWKKEPVAYGIFKIVIGATIHDDLVSTDLVQEKIEEFEDEVQSAGSPTMIALTCIGGIVIVGAAGVFLTRSREGAKEKARKEKMQKKIVKISKSQNKWSLIS
mgnify:CR=1 FL=1